MGTEPQKPQENTQPSKSDSKSSVLIDDIDRRLQIVEKTESNMSEMVKWGFGLGISIFTTVAALFVGFNWISANNNYERDKENFQQRQTLAQQEITVSNEKKLQELRNQIESSFLTLSNNLQDTLIRIEHTNDAKWFNVATAITNGATQAGIIITTNLTILRNKINSQVEYSLSNNVTSINDVLVKIQSKVDSQTSKSLASAAMAQGELFLLDKKDLSQLHESAVSLLVAAHLFFEAKDITNFRRCIHVLRNECVIKLMEKITKREFDINEAQGKIQDSVQSLISEVTKANTDGSYDDDISSLQVVDSYVKGRFPK